MGSQGRDPGLGLGAPTKRHVTASLGGPRSIGRIPKLIATHPAVGQGPRHLVLYLPGDPECFQQIKQRLPLGDYVFREAAQSSSITTAFPPFPDSFTLVPRPRPSALVCHRSGREASGAQRCTGPQRDPWLPTQK